MSTPVPGNRQQTFDLLFLLAKGVNKALMREKNERDCTQWRIQIPDRRGAAMLDYPEHATVPRTQVLGQRS